MSIKSYLQKLSFRTGVIVLLMCIPFYILSFVQVFFPVSTATKGILFTVFFGLAKSFQYGRHRYPWKGRLQTREGLF